MTARPKRTRPRKSDRLTSPDNTNQIECAMDHAVAVFDREAVAMDAKWGTDRLSDLVSPDTAAKWGTTLANLNTALQGDSVEDVVACVESARRGLVFMDAEATRLGHKPATGDFWEYAIGPFRFGILRDGAEWRTAKAKRPDLAFFTMQEVGTALQRFMECDSFEKVKEQFPNAKVVELTPKEKTPLERQLNDEIPF